MITIDCLQFCRKGLYLSFFALVFPVSMLVSQEMIYQTESNLSREEKERRLDPGQERSPHYAPQIPGTFSHTRIHPPFWWTGMKDPNLELVFYDREIGLYKAEINHPDVQLIESVSLENPNYRVLRLRIGEKAGAGLIQIVFHPLDNHSEKRIFEYELKNRSDHHRNISGLQTSDVIYLIMPDRFANGDYTNDSFEDMSQQGIDRRRIYYRHGGDLQGIIDRLDYLEELGITALWLNPVMENDQPYESYHGYAITDHYAVDKRLGSNELYKELSVLAKKRGIKIVHDVIYNHLGDHHWMFKDLPSKDFFHWHDEFTRTTYRSTTLMDPYAASSDKDIYQRGWFDNHMPDINQTNSIMANYLIQNTIWSIEYFRLNGLRIDTYSYADLNFMADLAKRVYSEYPEMGIFGETWVHGPGVQSFFAKSKYAEAEFDSGIEGLTDFQLYYAILEAFNQPQSWTSGVERIYYTLAQDHLYKNPFAHVTFVDNHDLDRFLSAVNENTDKFKAGLTLLFTTRGIPMIYYGTEIAMKNRADPDGWVREGFPGGWKEDEHNKFTEEGRSDFENEIFDFTRSLIKLRTHEPAFQNGQLIQFVPREGVYAFYRVHKEDYFLVLINASDKSIDHNIEVYLSELKGDVTGLENAMTGEIIESVDEIKLPAYQAYIFKIKGAF